MALLAFSCRYSLDQSMISLVNLLERLYTNPCYTTEFNRMTTCLAVGQYPQKAHDKATPAHYTWPAGGYDMLEVGLSFNGAIGSHLRPAAHWHAGGRLA
eukprot:466744-Amphidinium_carterae.1